MENWDISKLRGGQSHIGYAPTCCKDLVEIHGGSGHLISEGFPLLAMKNMYINSKVHLELFNSPPRVLDLPLNVQSSSGVWWGNVCDDSSSAIMKTCL